MKTQERKVNLFSLSFSNYLKGTANKELRRSLPQIEVGSLEDVATGPHAHHGHGHAVGGLVPAQGHHFLSAT